MTDAPTGNLHCYLLKKLRSIEHQNSLTLDQLVATHDDLKEIRGALEKSTEGGQ